MNVQRCQHITWGDTVHADVSVCPLDGERTCEMSDSGLGGIVWSLWLWDIYDGTGHATNHHH